MTKNKLSDLNNHLFEQLERLNDEELSHEELKREIDRSKAMGNMASNIISNASLALEASKFKAKGHIRSELPEMLENKKKNE